MPVFEKDDTAVLYIHVPKTAGSAIESFFADNGFRIHFRDTGVGQSLNRVRRCSPQHMHAQMLETVFDVSQFKEIFITVRHPIDRFVSEYLMRRRIQTANKRPVLPIEDWGLRVLRRYEADPYLLDNHLRPQHEFLIRSARVYRLEEGFEDSWTEAMSLRLGQKLAGAVPRVNAKLTSDPEIVEMPVWFRQTLENFYRGDLVQFGY